MESIKEDVDSCIRKGIDWSNSPIEKTMRVIGGKWKLLILGELFFGMRRFGELHKIVKGVTQKVLSQQLKELEKDGLIDRKIYSEIPPRVEYSLTPLGESLKPVITSIYHWGKENLCKS